MLTGVISCWHLYANVPMSPALKQRWHFGIFFFFFCGLVKQSLAELNLIQKIACVLHKLCVSGAGPLEASKIQLIYSVQWQNAVRTARRARWGWPCFSRRCTALRVSGPEVIAGVLLIQDDTDNFVHFSLYPCMGHIRTLSHLVTKPNMKTTVTDFHSCMFERVSPWYLHTQQ